MFRERMRDTIKTHGRGTWRNRGVWALTVYYYGVWANSLRFAPARWIAGKIYGGLSIFSEIVTGVVLDRSLQLPGEGLHIIHPTSVYIHRKTILGARVGIMHNVCLGTNMRPDEAPIIGDDVFIGTGAAILGNVKIGNGARIAAVADLYCIRPCGSARRAAIFTPKPPWLNWPSARTGC